jgi:tRNA pseudouridine38-40 synthase
MVRYHATISYDGSRYFGFQSQIKEITIQKVIEDALKHMTQTIVTIHSAGRTDKGVHAYGQSIHFDTHVDIDTSVFMKVLNKRLPLDVRVIKLRKVKDTFHARYSSVSKRYIYKLSKIETSPFDAFYMHYEPNLNYEHIKKAATLFEGTYDFFGFSEKVLGKQTIKTIYSVTIHEGIHHLYLEFHGNGFLKYMVRSIVGTIIEVGQGRKTFDDITNNLTEPKRSLAGKTAPASGLYLKKVYYKKTKDWYNGHR